MLGRMPQPGNWNLDNALFTQTQGRVLRLREGLFAANLIPPRLGDP